MVKFNKESVIEGNISHDQDTTEAESDSETIIKGARPLTEIYERCNPTSLMQPATYEEA